MHLQEACRNNMHEADVAPDLIQQLVCEGASEDKPDPPAPPLPPGRLPRPSKWVIIDVIDDAYKKAVSVCVEKIDGKLDTKHCLLRCLGGTNKAAFLCAIQGAGDWLIYLVALYFVLNVSFDMFG